MIPHGLWGNERAQAFADADAFCLPSATENFGIAAAEAACLGLPVVVSDECGVAEWLDLDATRTVPYGDIGALVAALRWATEGNAAQNAAKVGAPALQARLSWSRIAKEQVEMYEAACR